MFLRCLLRFTKVQTYVSYKKVSHKKRVFDSCIEDELFSCPTFSYRTVYLSDIVGVTEESLALI